MLTKPNNTSNLALVSTMHLTKNIDKLNEEAKSNRRFEKLHGYYAKNSTSKYYRIDHNEGSSLLKPHDTVWIWAESIIKVQQTELVFDWPESTVYHCGSDFI